MNKQRKEWILIFLSVLIVKIQAQAQKPNVILIMVDDMGWSDIAPYGGEIHTPTLSRLAKEGMRFTQFYNNAKCTTTRASLVTGLYPRRDQKDAMLLRSNMLTMGELFQLAGYKTVLSGKWHLGKDSIRHPVYRGFDEYYGLLDGCCNFFDPSIQDPPYKGNRIRYFAHNTTRLTSFPENYYTTDAFTDHAIASIKRFHSEGHPFFLHLTYTAPHYPLHAKEKDIAKYRNTYKEGWNKLREARYQRQLAMGLIDSTNHPLSGNDSRSYSWEKADHAFEDERMAVYAAMVDCVDQNLGKLMKALEEMEVDDHTLIMFLSDNGGCAEEPGGRDPQERKAGPKNDYVAVGPAWGWAQNTPFKRYKVWMHEGGIATPFIAWWPKVIPADTISREVGHIIDLMPTMEEVIQYRAPLSFNEREMLPLEGHSLFNVLKGGKRHTPIRYFWEYSGNRAARIGNRKIVWDKLVNSWELYDLESDQTETKNLAIQFSEEVDFMAGAWKEWAQKYGLKVKEAKN